MNEKGIFEKWRLEYGLALIVLGLVVGLWLGVWVMFIGGIVQIVNTVQVHPVHARGIAVGLVRILGASIVGFFSFTLLFFSWLGLIFSKSILWIAKEIINSDFDRFSKPGV